MADGQETATGGTAGNGAEVLDAALLGAELGERATLVQFSTAFCQPCRATRRVLDDVAALVPGVRHVEIDAEAHLGLVRAVGVERTPTVPAVSESTSAPETSSASNSSTRDTASRRPGTEL
ncbi:thioredoxin family protein, partial [Streptomyces albidoflavus]|uniref:thioredoxin family protein n=1 Tax=Streptomyces albidoflavus TaxID=1886 RepID=UPI0033C6B6E4